MWLRWHEHQRNQRSGLHDACVESREAQSTGTSPAAGHARGSGPGGRPDPVLAPVRGRQPYLLNDDPPPAQERLQTPEERTRLDGYYECILCACCTSACPSSWWNPETYIGPAGLLWADRFLAASRDTATRERLSDLDDPFSVFRCRAILNCTAVCPKGLNPRHAISRIQGLMVQEGV
jgi:succinate dehydrogenase/fumarate reductase-like Fe-S protein